MGGRGGRVGRWSEDVSMPVLMILAVTRMLGLTDFF